MQEMGIAAADAPTSWVTPVPIRLWFTGPELGHPLIDDNHDRPLHPLVGPFVRGYLSPRQDAQHRNWDCLHLYVCHDSLMCMTCLLVCTSHM